MKIYDRACPVCGELPVFKGYYSDGSTEFVGENWDCPNECNEDEIDSDD